jgi:hydroxyethylthiazole kinase-like uncharacterized protein yjeF
MPSSLLSIAAIRSIEHRALAQLPPFTLMYSAGQATATQAIKLTGTSALTLVIAGPGNNGGDAFEAARHLALRGHTVTILCDLAHSQSITDTGHPYHRALATTAIFKDFSEQHHVLNQSYDLVIDGLFGIGLTRPITGILATLVCAVNQLTCPVLAIDVPSGIHSDTGSVIGAHDGVAVRATHTITFLADKPGLHTCDGLDYSGQIIVDQLDVETTAAPVAQLLTPAQFSHAFLPRQRNTHKGSFGDVIIIGGSSGMTGAPILSARTALYAGAGRTTIAFAGAAPAYDMLQPELMFRQAETIDFSRAVLVAGPGLGTSDNAHALIQRVLSSPNTLVLDADALNLIAASITLQQQLAERPAITIITPHPLEAARLLGITVAEIQADRLSAARLLAKQFQVVTLVKGAGTVIGDTDETLFINTTGNPALATGGTGDVLAGLCGALLAQGLPALTAAQAAVWLHGHAADQLVTAGIGPIGLTAGELIPEIRRQINALSSSEQDKIHLFL